MIGAPPFRRLVMALWVLARTASTVPGAGQLLTTAIDDCASALRAVLENESHFILQERGGSLFANGVRLRFDVEAFVAMDEVCALLRRRSIGELLLTNAATRLDLQRLCAWLASPSRQFADAGADLAAAGVQGIFLAVRPTDHAGADPMPVRSTSAARGERSSRLQSVYLYNELLAAHGPAGLLRSQHVHTALQILAAHLLQRLGGRTPIELLPGDQTMLGAGVRVGVMVILLGQAVGCEAPLLGELALAGLLHHSGELGPVDDDVRSGAAILRCARRAVDLATAPGRSAADVVRLLAAEATAGSLPRDLVAPCADLLQVVVPVAPD